MNYLFICSIAVAVALSFAQSSSTTSAPKTSTATTPRSGPTASPDPASGNWTVHAAADKAVTCIILDSGFRVYLTDKPSFDVPSTAIASGSCDYDAASQTLLQNGTETMTLTWTGAHMDMDFSRNSNATKVDDGSRYALATMCLTMDNGETLCDNLGDTTRIYAPTDYFYSCKTKQNITLIGTTFNATVELDNFKLQAFTNSTVFKSSERKCPPDLRTNDLVPIIVGACLAALVVVVLVAYLIGRARAKRSTGYESV